MVACMHACMYACMYVCMYRAERRCRSAGAAGVWLWAWSQSGARAILRLLDGCKFGKRKCYLLAPAGNEKRLCMWAPPQDRLKPKTLKRLEFNLKEVRNEP